MTAERKWILLAALVGAVSLSLLAIQNLRSNPERFDDWTCPAVTIAQEERAEAVVYELRDVVTLDLITQLAGSTDLVCDPPRLVVWDVDRDGTEDLYFQHCGGQGYLSCDGLTIKYQSLHEADASFKSAGYRAVFAATSRAMVFTGLFASGAALVISALTRLWRRDSKGEPLL